ncbi:MAG: hypothetical protein II165_05635, partial [Bacteroidales bacterium]|nr:hypothetical protein [Bacteroidales bacterium]
MKKNLILFAVLLLAISCEAQKQSKEYTLTGTCTLSSDNDKVYLLQGGALKPLTAVTLATAVLNAGFGHVAVAEINGNEVI